jgi:hypothetical protein
VHALASCCKGVLAQSGKKVQILKMMKTQPTPSNIACESKEPIKIFSCGVPVAFKRPEGFFLVLCNMWRSEF